MEYEPPVLRQPGPGVFYSAASFPVTDLSLFPIRNFSFTNFSKRCPSAERPTKPFSAKQKGGRILNQTASYFKGMLRVGVVAASLVACVAFAAPLGLPPVPVPADNPITPDKVKLGDKLFHDTRFSSTGEVSCATWNEKAKGFTDALPVSEGINKLKGTRKAPTVINAAYLHTQFWDGREPTLEAQRGPSSTRWRWPSQITSPFLRSSALTRMSGS